MALLPPFEGSPPEAKLRRLNRDASATPSTSRLQPSEPLHMTTRAAIKAASNSATGSADSDNSRRSSVADDGNLIDDDNSNSAQTAQEELGSTQTNSPPAVEIEPPKEEENDSPAASDMESPKSRRPFKRKRVHETSSTTESNRANGTSGDAVTPEEVASDAQDLRPPPKRRSVRSRRSLKTNGADSAAVTPNSGSPVPQVADDEGAAEDEELGDAPTSERNSGNQAPTKATRRLPGRRRAPHPNNSIEADLRRQLSLKMGYRAVARALKPILAELAERDVEEIERNPRYHKQHEEYQRIVDFLDSNLEEKLASLNREYEIKIAHLERVKEAEEHIFKNQCGVSTARDETPLAFTDGSRTRCEICRRIISYAASTSSCSCNRSRRHPAAKLQKKR